MESFRSADRIGMLHAVRSLMLKRSGIEDLLGQVAVPTLVMSARDDVMGWRPDEAKETCAAIPDCRVEEVAGTGHVAPLLIDHDRIGQLIIEAGQPLFRSSAPTVVRRGGRRCRSSHLPLTIRAASPATRPGWRPGN